MIGFSKEYLIRHYFKANFSYSEVLHFLATFHGIKITLRHLHRLLRKYKLYRRRGKSPINQLLEFVKNELCGSSSSFGYRTMHMKLREQGFVVDKETVRIVLKSLDPQGVEKRSAHRLQRRVYRCAGPNHVWHIDGYDKLKSFGFAIHGGIDGFSRKILWLQVGKTNNDPRVTASYFIDCVDDLKVIPRVIRADRGSENVVIGGIQRYMRKNHTDSLSGSKSFRYGKSTANQRIESWWSQLRRSRMNWWINFFKDMTDQNLLDASLGYHIECIRFCFMGLIQEELDEVKRLWNKHYIRQTWNAECPAGRPDVMYFTPERFGGNNGASIPNADDMVLVKSHCKPENIFHCSTEFLQLATLIMNENNIAMPTTFIEAKEVFLFLVNEIRLL